MTHNTRQVLLHKVVGIFHKGFIGCYTRDEFHRFLEADIKVFSPLQAISQLFSSYPPSGAFCQVSELTIPTIHGCLREMCIWSKLGQTLLEMHIGAFARIKNVI